MTDHLPPEPTARTAQNFDDPASGLMATLLAFGKVIAGTDAASAMSAALLADAKAVAVWLRKSEDPKTYRAMEKEILRFLLWLVYVRRMTICDVSREDIQAFKSFLRKPMPVETWVSKTKWRRGHENWRPFASAEPSGQARRYAFEAVARCFELLTEIGYISRNPTTGEPKPSFDDNELKAGKGERTGRRGILKRILPLDAIELALLAADSAGPSLKAARDRFILKLYYLTGLRTFEGTKANMVDIQTREVVDPETGAMGIERWLPVVGKRKKLREIPFPAELYEELLAYRESFGLPREISSKESTPLVMASNRLRKRASNSTVLKAIHSVMDRAAMLARERGRHELVGQIELATTHWLRHSCLSHMLEATGDLTLVKDQAGHVDIKTTSIYLHSDDSKRYAAVNAALSLRGPRRQL